MRARSFMRLRVLRHLPSWMRRGRRRRATLLHELNEGPCGLAGVLFEQSGTGLAAIDRAGRLLRSNAALQEMAGATDLPPGMAAAALFGAGEQDREGTMAELTPALHGHAPRPAFATTLRGTGAAVSVTVTTLREVDGGLCGALLRVSDISAQRELEGQLAQAQKLQAVGQLAGGIAHDFNNLLTAILGAAETVATCSGLPTEVAEDVAQIRTSAVRGGQLVRQLLAFGRQQQLQPQVLALNDVVRDLGGLLRRLIGSHVRLELDLEEGTRQIRADPTQLDQVLVNLVVNARDAMPEGGLLTVRTRHRTLHRVQSRGAELIPPGRYVMIEVEDSGIGIPPEILPQIFDPFFTTRRESGGTGLGLSTVHGIVRQSDGFLEVDSVVGQGTRFRIYLPRWDDRTEVVIPEPPASGQGVTARPSNDVADATRGTVLLVDDEEPVRRLAERALSRAGWRVLTADSGEAALAALQAHGPAGVCGVVTDMVMPGMDGVEVLRAIRAQVGLPQLPALLMSGYAEASLREALAGESNVSFLAKPYALRELVDAFEAVIDPAAMPAAA